MVLLMRKKHFVKKLSITGDVLDHFSAVQRQRAVTPKNFTRAGLDGRK